jgi:hypothetical protein
MPRYARLIVGEQVATLSGILKIELRYNLFLSILAAIPFDLIVDEGSQRSALVLGLLKLPRLFRLSRVFRAFCIAQLFCTRSLAAQSGARTMCTLPLTFCILCSCLWP